jgi:hypothetical protein
MRLYHTTKKENQKLIEVYGSPRLAPGNQQDLHYTTADETLQGTEICGIFGFTDIQDAKDFGYENGGDFIIYAFEASGEIIDDPEYASDPDFLKGEAKFFVTEDYVESELVVYGE